MKIFMINTVCGMGSTGRICTELAKSFEQQGHEVKITYRGTQVLPADAEKYGVRVGSKKDVYFHALASRVSDRAGFYSKKATRKLVQAIREYAPDVIHLHNLHGYYVNLKILFDYLKTEFKGKVIWTLHDCWAFTGHCVHYSYVGCDKWKTGCKNCPQKKTYPTAMFADRSQKNYEEKKRLFTGVPNMTIVTVSQWLKEQVQASFLGGYPVVRVYNGIDYSIYRPLESDIRETLGVGENKMILSVSSGWDDRKGYGRLLALAAKAPQDWRFVVVGLSKEQIARLPQNCIGMERTWDREEMVKLYTAANVFYHPSVEETFGLVTAEALACGTYGVVMDSTACPEPLGENGLVLKTGDPEEAVSKISQVMTWDKCVPQQQFTKEKMTNGYLACYAQEKEEAI